MSSDNAKLIKGQWWLTSDNGKVLIRRGWYLPDPFRYERFQSKQSVMDAAPAVFDRMRVESDGYKRLDKKLGG